MLEYMQAASLLNVTGDAVTAESYNENVKNLKKNVGRVD
jgi:hypothetical protein